MLQKITGFHTDDEGHWVAELACGHRQHVRHAPPVTLRPWVVTPEGRRAHLGVQLGCVRCDEAGLRVAEAVRAACAATLVAAYEEAGMSGLCAEGRWEAALGAVGAVDLAPVVAAAVRG